MDESSKKIAVIVGRKGVSETSTSTLVADMKQVSDLNISILHFSDLIVRIGDTISIQNPDKVDLSEYDAVYLRSNYKNHIIRGVIAQYLQYKEIPVANPETANYQPYDKTSQYMRLSIAGLSTPRTVFCKKEAFSEELAEELGYPIIIKANLSNSGKDNHLFENYQEVREFLDRAEGEYVFQSFIPNNFDYRMIMIDGEVSATYSKTRDPKSDTHLNNMAQGGEVEHIEQPDQNATELAKKATKAMGRKTAGVDIMQNSETGELIVLEVNYVSDNFHTDSEAKEVIEMANFLKNIAK